MHDLIFHLVTESDWNLYRQNEGYKPETVEQEGFIHCSTGDQIKETANRLFKNADDLRLLVIDVKRVQAPIKYEEDSHLQQSFPHIYGALNFDAMLDKIPLSKNKEGNFDLDFHIN